MTEHDGAICSDLDAHNYVVGLPIREGIRELLMLTSGADRELARAWFQTAHPGLDDRIPMVLLWDLPLEEIQHPLLSTALAFKRGRPLDETPPVNGRYTCFESPRIANSHTRVPSHD